MNRKDEHIHLAKNQVPTRNDFDLIRFKHHAFPETNLDEIDLAITLFGRKFPTPLYLNAMTGGTLNAQELNRRFAMLAKHFDLPMATGSLSIALKDPKVKETFTIVRDLHPRGFIFANLGAGQTPKAAQLAVNLLKANAFQLHINAVQEAIMPEGDKTFRGWLASLAQLKHTLQVPMIVKEVGFGMSRKTIQSIKEAGVEWIDVAGRGGTNFAVIENLRRKHPYSAFEDWGLSTVESLLEAQHVPGIQVFASGGVRHPLDVIKALALGAKAVGLSGYFLHLVSEFNHDQAIEKFQLFLDELKTIMLVLGKKTIGELATSELIMDAKLIQYQNQIR